MIRYINRIMCIENIVDPHDYKTGHPVKINNSQINNIESLNKVEVKNSVLKTIKARSAILVNSKVGTVMSKRSIEIEDSMFTKLKADANINVKDCSGISILGKNIKVDYTDPYNSKHDRFTFIKGDKVDLFRLYADTVVSKEDAEIASSNIQDLTAEGNISLRYSMVDNLKLMITTQTVIKLFRSTIKNLYITSRLPLEAVFSMIQYDLDPDSKIEKTGYSRG